MRILLTAILSIIALLSCNNTDNKSVHLSDTKTLADSTQLKHIASMYDVGRKLFVRFCNKCHYTPDRNIADQYTFDNLFERLPQPSEDYFINYISDSEQLRTWGNEYAKKTKEVYGQDYEHKFKDSISTYDFRNLILYIKIAAKYRYAKD